eukprot:CAMPEP_0180453594 /NCGR_PEP_ID=MMETSP1036_2-20121128/19849_1 /TAXON_ID=632150 /ORGANISM="Azadinium spinosum, Strain 3D9" /LENGTH=392 /DNA_ID=CAMNT_0022460099 /DNA_START=203 /DNA_END=1381 /DNA_ORIENTATION=+
MYDSDAGVPPKRCKTGEVMHDLRVRTEKREESSDDEADHASDVSAGMYEAGRLVAVLAGHLISMKHGFWERCSDISADVECMAAVHFKPSGRCKDELLKVLAPGEDSGRLLLFIEWVEVLPWCRGKDACLDLIDHVIDFFKPSLTILICHGEVPTGKDKMATHFARMGFRQFGVDGLRWMVLPTSFTSPLGERLGSRTRIPKGVKLPDHPVREIVAPPFVGGFTPRNHFYMRWCAACLADTALSQIDDCGFQNGRPLDDPYIIGMECIPEDFRHRMYKSFAMGFAIALKAIWRLLELKQFPTKECIMQEMLSPGYDQRYTSHFFQKGGDVMWALCAVAGDAEDEEQLDEADELPEHPDDDDFDLVRRHLGIRHESGTVSMMKLRYGVSISSQ